MGLGVGRRHGGGRVDGFEEYWFKVLWKGGNGEGRKMVMVSLGPEARYV